MKIFSRGNHKLPRNIAIFNIPEIKTCPGKTKACTSFCYAKKASIQYHHVVPPQQKRNLRLSISKYFVHKICTELSVMKSVDTVRLHSSGDFYSQVYLNKWITISYKFPQLVFFAYTKSYMLDYSKIPKNFIIFYSSDWTTKHYSIQLKNHAIMAVDHKKNGKQKTLTFNNKPVLICPGSCKKCNYCYTKPEETKLLSFPLH